MTSDYLYHHGILGQKWGVRRYQNKDGSLTSAGAKRYANEIAARELVKQRQTDLSRARGYEERKQARIKLDNAERAIKYAKERDATLNATGPKSERRKKYEQQYKDKGYSDEDAAIAARNKERTRKILLGVGGVALAAAAAYGAYKYHDYVTDTILDNKTNLYRYAVGENGLYNNFYATPDAKDARKYVGLYGGQQLFWNGTGQQKTIRLQNAVRVASEKNAKKILGDLVQKDPQFKTAMIDSMKKRQQLFRQLGVRGRTVDMFDKAIEDVNKGKVSRTVYDAMNRCVNDRDTNTGQRFIDALKERGYGAIVDINDRKYSGYNTRRPLIIFDASNANIEKLRDVGYQEIVNTNQAIMNEAVRDFGKKVLASVGAATGGAVAGSKAVSRAKERRAIQRYKQEHPNTKMSDVDILDALSNKSRR